MARAVIAAVLALAASPSAAPAAAAKPPQPWATVNVCDTARHPNAVGVRASMPGSGGLRERMFMRFRVQWRDPADHLWHNLLAGGDSGFIGVGSARHRVRQAGLIFRYDPPRAGQALRLRGVVRFEWRRRGGRVVRALTRTTTAHHRSDAGSDPKRYSAASCVLSGD
jgi:hypothetical protein